MPIRRQSPFPFLLSAVRAMRVVAGALPAVVDREALLGRGKLSHD